MINFVPASAGVFPDVDKYRFDAIFRQADPMVP